MSSNLDNKEPELPPQEGQQDPENMSMLDRFKRDWKIGQEFARNNAKE